jgi:branched-chain amino acid aminotransferase
VALLEFEASGPGLVPRREAPPEGVYTTLRTYQGDRVLRLAAHVHRLNESAALRELEGQVDERRIRRAIALALLETGYDESRLRLTFAPPRLFVGIEAYIPLPAALYREGVACSTVPLQRRNPHAKDTRFASEAASAHQALPQGVHEGLLLAPDGALLEGLSSNLFALVDGVLRTEEARALLGVTRSLVVEVAQAVVAIGGRAPLLREVPRFAECFLTSVSRGILPVVSIDGRAIGEGRPGPLTRELTMRFESLVEREAERVTAASP